MVAGLFTVIPLQAGAENAYAAEKPLLFGDVDGDGEVTVLDAVLIQKYTVDLPTPDNFVLKLADVDGDGEVSVFDALCIQRYAADYTVGTGKAGQPYDGDKTFTVKSVPVLRSSLDSTETAELRFYDDQPNVPYIGVEAFYNQFYLVNTDLTDGIYCSRDGGKYTLTNIIGCSAVFDVDADTIYTANLENFTYNAYTLLVAMEGGVDASDPFIKTEAFYEYGVNIDFGCPLDADLLVGGENKYANFYDLSLLSEKMNEYFEP